MIEWLTVRSDLGYTFYSVSSCKITPTYDPRGLVRQQERPNGTITPVTVRHIILAEVAIWLDSLTLLCGFG